MMLVDRRQSEKSTPVVEVRYTSQEQGADGHETTAPGCGRPSQPRWIDRKVLAVMIS